MATKTATAAQIPDPTPTPVSHFLAPYLAAAFPAVAISSFEEERVISSINNRWPNKRVFMIAATGGLKDARNGQVLEAAFQYSQAFQRLADISEAILYVLDYQTPLQSAVGSRNLKSWFARLKQIGSMVVLIVPPTWKMPPELTHDIPMLDFPLPSRVQLGVALDLVAESAGTDLIVGEQREKCLDGATGLTLTEAENTFSKVYASLGWFDPDAIAQDKMRQIKQSGLLEIYPAVPLDQLGGLDEAKKYLQSEVVPSLDDALLRVRGLLLCGVPGSGKSLFSRVVGAVIGWPVLRCDISALKGSLVGQSEANVRSMLALAQAVSPCVLVFDEFEKAIGGYQSSSHTDGGVTSGILGTLLTFMQDHTSPILIVATCNDHTKLPPEMTRRFDEQFFVDLPTATEREAIANVHLKKFGVDKPLGYGIARLTDGWTGAEIEKLIKSAARRTQRAITDAALVQAAAEIKPLSKTRADEVQKLRDWAKNTLRPANSPEVLEVPTKSRKVSREV